MNVLNVYDTLTEREQKVILAVEQGEPYEAIAERLGITSQRVKHLERRAREKIKKEDRLNEERPYII